MDVTKIVKDAHESGKLMIGSRSVIKNLKTGKVIRIVCASNCPENYIKSIDMHSKSGKTEVLKFQGDSVRLGETCGKPFTVLMVGIKK
jgi:large subunit ribosomal protein L30e